MKSQAVDRKVELLRPGPDWVRKYHFDKKKHIIYLGSSKDCN